MKNSERNPRQTRQIFISYSRADRIAVDKFVDDLRRRHYVLWMDVDETGISPGEDWARELVEQMEASEAVIQCISPDSLRSEFCRQEIEQAKRENKPIFPVLVRRLDKEQVMPDSHLQFVDLTQDYDAGVRRLLVVLPRPRFPRALVMRYAAIIAAVTAMLIIVGAALSFGLDFLNPPTPTPIPSLDAVDVGIAVAYFALDSQVNSENAERLIDQVAALLQAEIADFNAKRSFQFEVLPPSQVGHVEGTDASVRKQSAKALAERYKADIVLYGIIELNELGLLEVTPAFYVEPEGFTEALEITGDHRLGSAIRVENNTESLAQAMQVNRPLYNRTIAAANIFQGITFYALQDYTQALTAFQQANDLPGWDDGRDVLHVLLGNARLGQASLEAQGQRFDSALEQLALAREEYQQALTSSGEDELTYSRPYTALASASLLEWNINAQESGVSDIALLKTAQEYLDEAENADLQPGDEAVAAKDDFVRVQVGYALWANHQSALGGDSSQEGYDTLVRTATRITRAYEDSQPALRQIASETYAYLGLIAYGRSECEDGVEQYQKALDAATSPQRRMFFYGWKGECHLLLAERDKALEAFQRALELAEMLGTVPDVIKTGYENRIAELQAKS